MERSGACVSGHESGTGDYSLLQLMNVGFVSSRGLYIYVDSSVFPRKDNHVCGKDIKYYDSSDHLVQNLDRRELRDGRCNFW